MWRVPRWAWAAAVVELALEAGGTFLCDLPPRQAAVAGTILLSLSPSFSLSPLHLLFSCPDLFLSLIRDL